MQAYFDPEQAFIISMPQPVFEISIAYKKKHVVMKDIFVKLMFNILKNYMTFTMIYPFFLTEKKMIKLKNL